MRILVEGHYSCGSSGDDASLDALQTMIRAQVAGDTTIVVAARHPNPTYDTDFGVSTKPNLEYATKAQSAGRWLRGFNPDDDPSILQAYAETIAQAGLLVLGAGNFLNENSFGLFRGMLARLSIAAWIARTVGTPCMLYAMSATRLESQPARAMCTWLLDNVDAVTFREQDSIDVLRGCGVAIPDTAEVLPDPVVLSRCADASALARMLATEEIPRGGSRPRLGVSVRSLSHMGSAAHEAYMRTITEVVEAWLGLGGEVVLIPQQTYDLEALASDDRVLNQEIRDAVAPSPALMAVQAQYLPWGTEALWSTCDVALCTRLHAGVFACKQGVPVVALSYEPKVSGFWRQMGVAEYCLDLGSSAEAIVLALQRSLREYPREAVSQRLSQLQLDAQRYATIASELLGANQ